jgi:hypothetical protein
MEPNSQTVLIVSYHFHPSNEIGARRLTALARYLVRRGFRVIVVSSFGDKDIACDSEIEPGIVAVPVARPDRTLLDAAIRLKRALTKGKKDTSRQSAGASYDDESVQSVFGKLRELYFRTLYIIDDVKRWSWRASNAAIAACRRYNAQLLVASGPPSSVLLAGVRAASKVGIPYIADLRDPWSDSLAYYHPDRRLEIGFLRLLERWVLARAVAVTSTGEDAAALLKHRNGDFADKIYVLRNGYDGEIESPLSRTAGRLSILFAGELYVGRNPFPFLSGLESLLGRREVDATRIDVTFMGKVDVYAGESLTAWVTGKRCGSVVRILPPQSAQVVADATKRATVLLNLAQRQALSVPAKTFEQLASGREILLLCEDHCETARLVAGIKGVSQVDPGDFDKLSRVLIELYRRHVTHGICTPPGEQEVLSFSRSAANERFYSILSSIMRLRSEPNARKPHDVKD